MLTGSLSMICLAGLAAGLIHVWSGMDHLAALTPLSFGKGRHAAMTGASWGLGHSAGVVAVALAGVALKSAINVHEFSSFAERLVGLVLIALGVWGIRKALRMHLHAHAHTHDGKAHSHLHTHADGHERPAGSMPHRHTHAAVAVGTLHGFAGAGHFLAVLPAIGLQTWAQSLSYLGTFALGTVIGMSGFAALIGWSSLRAQLQGGEQLARHLMLGAGSLTVTVGMAWIILPLMGWQLP